MQSNVALRAPYTELQSQHALVNTPAAVLEFPAVDISVDSTSSAASAVVHEDMHPGVYKVAVLSWAIFLGVFWFTFWASANALFMVAFSTIYAIVFFGVPVIMSRCIPNASVREHGLAHFLKGKVDTLYGPVHALEALAQVIMVPVALILGGTAIAFAIQSARLAY
jgi:hypothetical protein